MKKAGVIALVSAASLSGVNAWGNDGHEIVGSIATQFLSKEAQTLVQNVLGGQDLTSVATWADVIKEESEYRWSAPLHYINTPDWECSFVYDQDCSDDVCVAGAIANYTTRIGSTDGDQQTEALKFLVHFVGDIHQPLHVAFASDEGGNTEKGTFLDFQHKALHAIWDTSILETRMNNDFQGSQADWTAYLVNRTTGDLASQVPNWNQYAAKDENNWGAESAAIACKYAYTDETGAHITDGFDLQDSYYEFVLDTVEQQLIKGGIRLAAALNLLAGGSSTPTPTPFVQIS